MQLTWGDVNNETGFRIERSLDAGASWSVFQTLGRDTTFAYDTNVPIERQFCYRVFAFNAQGDSPPSTTVCSAIPLAPTDLVAQVVESAIVLTWTDNSALETGYAIARNADDGSSIILLLPANTTTYRDASALADHVYRYSVEAKSGFGGSGHSNMVTAVIATTPPMTPTSVAVSPVSSSSAEITWTASSNTEGLRIERSGDSGASWATAGTSNGYGDLFDDYELASEQQVCYRVFAFNSHGESAPSSNVCTTPPAAPTDLMATWESDGQTVDLSWTDRSNVEDSYEVWVFNDWESYPIVTLGPNATTYADSYYGIYGYSYVVVALKDGGYSDWSNSASPVAASAPASASLRQGSVLPRPRGSKRP